MAENKLADRSTEFAVKNLEFDGGTKNEKDNKRSRSDTD